MTNLRKWHRNGCESVFQKPEYIHLYNTTIIIHFHDWQLPFIQLSELVHSHK